MGIFLSLIFIAAFCFLIWKLNFFRTIPVSWKILVLLFLVKAIAGLGLNFLYKTYYDSESADVYRYFSDGNIIYSVLRENPADYLQIVTGIGADSPHLQKYYMTTDFWIKEYDFGLYNDNRTIIRFNAIVRLISFGYLSVHTVIMAFLSFIGITAIFKTIVTYVPEKKNLLLAICFLIPSVLFWTSSVLKEGLLMFAFGFFLFSSFQLMYHKFASKNLVIFCLSLFLLFISKFYVLVAVLPGLISLILIQYLKIKRKSWLIFTGTHIFILILAANIHLVSPFNPVAIISQKQEAFVKMISFLDTVGSQMQIPKVEPNVTSILIHSPQAIANTLIRPHILEIYSPVVLMAAVENLLILLFILLCVVKPNRTFAYPELIFFCLSFSLILFDLSGLTTPVMGALVRYKTPGIPFFMMAFLFILNDTFYQTMERKIILVFRKLLVKLKLVKPHFYE